MKQLLLSIPLTAAALVACADDTGIGTEDQQASTAVTVEEGIPHYTTSQAYFDYGLKMANMDPDERKRLEAAEGFTSMQTYAESLLSDIDANEKEIKSRPEMFSFAADTVDDALMVRADIEVPTSMAVAANQDGLYYIGDAICKVDRYSQASVKNGDAETVGRVLSGEVEADGQTSQLFRYDLGGGTLKAATIQIDEISGTLSNSSLWTDYSAKIYINRNLNEDGKIAEICLLQKSKNYKLQKSKNYKKRHKRWKEHRGWNAYRNVNVMVLHPTISNNTQKFYIDDYYGGNTVNHSYTSTVKKIYESDNNRSTEDPYFNSISGSVSVDGFSIFMDLNTLFGEELKKYQNQ